MVSEIPYSALEYLESIPKYYEQMIISISLECTSCLRHNTFFSRWRRQPSSLEPHCSRDPHLRLDPSFFLSKTYLYYWIRKTYKYVYEYKYVQQGYRSSCPNQTAKESIRKRKITARPRTPILANITGDFHRR